MKIVLARRLGSSMVFVQFQKDRVLKKAYCYTNEEIEAGDQFAVKESKYYWTPRSAPNDKRENVPIRTRRVALAKTR